MSRSLRNGVHGLHFRLLLLLSTVGVSSLLAGAAADGELHGFSSFRSISPRLVDGGLGGRAGRLRRDAELLSTKTHSGGHLERLTLELPLDASSHLLDLELNKDLIPHGYFERTQRENLEAKIRQPSHWESPLCHYHGRIRGEANSWAALSTCDGLRGMVFDGKEIHYLEPQTLNAPHTESNTSSLESSPWKTMHFKDAHRLRNLTCDHSQSQSPPARFHSSGMLGGMKGGRRVKRGAPTSDFHVPYNSGMKTRYVEMVIVVDKRKYDELGKDLGKVILRTKDIANIVNALYVPLDIFVALVGVVVWTQQDAFNISTKGDDTLSKFLVYRKERLLKEHPNDNAQLLTAVAFEDGVVGKAMQGPICSYKFSGGVNSDHKSVVGIVATTIAHELGHNFGLSHDTDDCKCDGPESKCIMSASSSSNRTAHWSSCSLQSMKYALDHGMDYCLRKKPRSLLDTPSCGNGFVENGEECDCGHPEHCTNHCCNAHTCRLHLNATCGAGTCCDTKTCELKSGGTVCRPEQSQCDLPEFCTGESEFCPEDVHKLDGLTCETKNGVAHCAGGLCRTHSDQCQLLWGPTGNNSGDVCYLKNLNGSRYGHCGFNLVTEKYASCARTDIKCGILQCEHHHEKLEFGYESVAQLSSFFVNVGGTIHPCRSVTTDFGLDVVDPGLVPDGAVCAPNKMCRNQKCVSVEEVKRPLLCPNDCSGNGICNSKGHCHCKYGFGGEECSSGGYGGSVDSGPIVNPQGGASVFARALYVTFLGFIPLIGVISFYLYYAGDNLKRLFKRSQVVTRNQAKEKSHASQNGSAGAAIKDISNPSSANSNVGNAETRNDGSGMTGGLDLFGQYKGFSLSPIHNAPSGPTTTHINNNITNTSNQKMQHVELPPLPPIPTESAVHVRNEKPSFLKTIGRGVSWKEPVASSAPISPDQDDVVSNTSDTPLTPAATNHKQPSKIRPLSSPDALNDKKLFGPSTHPKKSGFGSTSALSRLASAFPFVRSFSSESSENQTSPRSSSASLTRQRSFNRGTLEISNPILQKSIPVQDSRNCVAIQGEDIDVVDAKTEHRSQTLPTSEMRNSPHFADAFSAEPTKSPRLSLKSKPVPKIVDRVKNQAPLTSPSPLQTCDKTQAKVQRAQSMIQPNRNSVIGNANYNSLRRSRPTVPPPKPPAETRVDLFEPPPPLITTSLPNKPNSILKFTNNNPQLMSKAPIAKLEDSDIGSPMSNGSPSPRNGNSKAENIYDVIDEGVVAEKVETMSTGSSEGGGFGLLSEIISEIESRNKESIYNSVDRRKKKKEKFKMLSTKENEDEETPKNARITINPNFKQSSPQPIKKPTVHLPSSSAAPTPKSPPPVPVPVRPASQPKVPKNGEAGDKEVSLAATLTTKEVSPNMSGKPTCAVNGIPKVTTTNSSQSYVAKINYFSNLSGTKAEAPAMKPISSLSQALITAAADKEKEPVYAPGQLSTIRPTWSRKSSIGKGDSGGIYSKPVATPQIPFTPIKDSSSQKERSRSSSPVLTLKTATKEAKTTTEKAPQGYKSFNPYLNRPLTFSTFRPTSTEKALGGAEPLSTNGMCSAVQPPFSKSLLSPALGLGLVTSPVQLRSPSRLLKS